MFMRAKMSDSCGAVIREVASRYSSRSTRFWPPVWVSLAGTLQERETSVKMFQRELSR